MKTSPVQIGQTHPKTNIKSTSIHIGDIVIHQSENGLYSLHDLWKASGGETKHGYKAWFKTKQPDVLITELSNGGEIAPFKISIKGKYGGVYVCKELAYAYAMWLSPKFYLLVIRTFDTFIIQAHNAWAQGELQSVNARHPHDKRTLGSILGGLSATEVKPYFQYLESIGEVRGKPVPQPDKIIYHRTQDSKAVIGSKGVTLLFSDTVKALFPIQTDWAAAL